MKNYFRLNQPINDPVSLLFVNNSYAIISSIATIELKMADREPFVGTMTSTDDFTNLKPIYSAGSPHQCCSVRLCMYYPKPGFVFLNNNNINNGMPCTTKKRRHLFLHLKPLLSLWRNTYKLNLPSVLSWSVTLSSASDSVTLWR